MSPKRTLGINIKINLKSWSARVLVAFLLETFTGRRWNCHGPDQVWFKSKGARIGPESLSFGWIWQIYKSGLRLSECKWTEATVSLTSWPSSVRHEWAVLGELWGRAGRSRGDAEADQAAHHQAHAQDHRRVPRLLTQDLPKGFPARLPSKLPTAVSEAADEPQHQPPAAPLHPGPHSQVQSVTLWLRQQKWNSIKTLPFFNLQTCWQLKYFTFVCPSAVDIRFEEKPAEQKPQNHNRHNYSSWRLNVSAQWCHVDPGFLKHLNQYLKMAKISSSILHLLLLKEACVCVLVLARSVLLCSTTKASLCFCWQ